MDAFLRDAEQILETAVAAQSGPAEHLIAVLRSGSLRMLSEVTGWSLSALAMEYGASAVYRVIRRASQVRVEAWSLGRTCTLTRELPARAFSAHQFAMRLLQAA
ncbi:MAG: hypothetical protein JO336_02330 [Acidobacteriia bacterium]|nr:hypothetical protein [Terriglobia bacterium]MBV8903016.1 hypothetical protein [Terriglobia bacterium]MBV9742152.1 hypothetical protein [Terriglobia bacterium]